MTIFEKYPEIFRIVRGFECGEGWNELIDKMCQVIMETCQENGWEPPVAHQVKEKFGGLRFYTGGTHDEIHDIIGRACMLSRFTCETCGKPGNIGGKSWLRAACSEHTRD